MYGHQQTTPPEMVSIGKPLDTVLSIKLRVNRLVGAVFMSFNDASDRLFHFQ